MRWKGKRRILGDDEGVVYEAEFGANTDEVDLVGRSSSCLSHATAYADKSTSSSAFLFLSEWVLANANLSLGVGDVCQMLPKRQPPTHPERPPTMARHSM